MAIFRGVGSVGDIADNSLLEEITAQAEAAEASATAAANSATSALNTELTSASFNTSDGVLTLTKQDNETVTTDLDGRFLPLSGGTLTGTLTTSNIAVASGSSLSFASAAFLISSNGTESIIRETGTGDLSIEGENLYLRSSPTANYLSGTAGAEVKLYHNNSEKLATTSGGISVTGTITATGYNDSNWNAAYNDKINSASFDTSNGVLTLTQQDGGTVTVDLDGRYSTDTGISLGDNQKATFGDDNDLEIYHDGTNSYVKDTGTGYLILGNSDAGTIIKNGSGQNLLTTTASEIRLGHEGNTKLATKSTGIDVTGTLTADGLDVGTSTSGIINLLRPSTNYIRANQTGGSLVTGVRDNIRFCTGQASGDFLTNERMRIDSSGNVGIGTGSPVAPLQVNGTIYAEGGSFDAPDDGNPPSGSDVSSNVAFVMPRGKKIAFWHDGYVRRLLESTSSGVIEVGQTGTSYISGINLNCGTGGDVAILNSTGDAGLTVEGALTAGGNLGVGTTSPAGKLHVSNGSSGATVNSNADDLIIESATNAGISILGDGNETQYLMFGDAADSAVGRVLYDHSTNHMALWTSASEAMRIDSSGNVGIGTTSPSTALDVNGTVTATGLVAGGNTYPTTQGTNGQVIVTDGNGTLSFADQSGGGGSGNVVDDTTPQLGGDLDTNGNDILFKDNDEAKFGDDSDMRIYHTGTTGYIQSNRLYINSANVFGGVVGLVKQYAQTTVANRWLKFQTSPKTNGNSAYFQFHVRGYVNSEAIESHVDYNVYLHYRGQSSGDNLYDLEVVGHEVGAGSLQFGVKFGITNEFYIFVPEDYSGVEVYDALRGEGSNDSSFDGAWSETGTDPTGITFTTPKQIALNNETIEFADGTHAAPSITFANDTDTGISSSIANTLDFSVGGNDRMRLNSSGNLLVGTTSAGSLGAKIRAQGRIESSSGFVATSNGSNFEQAGNYGGAGLSIDGYTTSTTATQKMIALRTSANVEKGNIQIKGNHVLFGCASGNYLLGASTAHTPTAKLDIDGDTIRLRSDRTPASATATGNKGDICYDSNYIYVCVATNTWKRTAIDTW